MKINVINTETLKKFLKEEISSVVKEDRNRACRSLSEQPVKGEFFIIGNRRDYLWSIASCAYGDGMKVVKMSQFYMNNANEEIDGLEIMPLAVERRRRARSRRPWPNFIRSGDIIYIPTDEELESGEIQSKSSDQSIEKPDAMSALGSVVDALATLRDDGEEALRSLMRTPFFMASGYNGRRWALAAKCAEPKWEAARALHDILCSETADSEFCGGCEQLTNNEVETYKRRVRSDLRDRMTNFK